MGRGKTGGSGTGTAGSGEKIFEASGELPFPTLLGIHQQKLAFGG